MECKLLFHIFILFQTLYGLFGRIYPESNAMLDGGNVQNMLLPYLLGNQHLPAAANGAQDIFSRMKTASTSSTGNYNNALYPFLMGGQQMRQPDSPALAQLLQTNPLAAQQVMSSMPMDSVLSTMLNALSANRMMSPENVGKQENKTEEDLSWLLDIGKENITNETASSTTMRNDIDPVDEDEKTDEWNSFERPKHKNKNKRSEYRDDDYSIERNEMPSKRGRVERSENSDEGGNSIYGPDDFKVQRRERPRNSIDDLYYFDVPREGEKGKLKSLKRPYDDTYSRYTTTKSPEWISTSTRRSRAKKSYLHRDSENQFELDLSFPTTNDPLEENLNRKQKLMAHLNDRYSSEKDGSRDSLERFDSRSDETFHPRWKPRSYEEDNEKTESNAGNDMDINSSNSYEDRNHKKTEKPRKKFSRASFLSNR